MKPNEPNIRRILVYTAILSLLVYYSVAWVNMLEDLYKRTGSDFIGFYTFGRISQTQGYSFIYDFEKQQKLEEELVGHPVVPIFYTHLPFIAPLARVLVSEDYVGSFKRWAVILLFLNAINIHILMRLLDISKFVRNNIVILFLGAYLFDPTFSGFMNGQDTAILLTGAALWMFGFFSDKYLLSGVGLGLTTVRPQIALFLAIPFLFQHRKVFWGFVLGGGALALVSIVLLGTDGSIRYIESIRYIGGTVWMEGHALDMPTLSGIIRRNFATPVSKPIQYFVWLCYVFGIIGFSLLWARSTHLNEKHIGLLSIAAIFVVPYAHYHDLILLLIPIFCLIRLYQRDALVHQDYLSIIPLVISWFLTLGFIGSGNWKYPIVYTVMLLLVFLLCSPDKIPKFFVSSSA